MGPAPISTTLLLTAIAIVGLLEVAAAALATRIPIPGLWLIAATRLAQMLAVMALAVVQAGGLHVLGLEKKSILPGCKTGLLWSAGFAAAAGLLFLVLFMVGQHPLAMIRTPLPVEPFQQILFFFVAGIVAPIFEEIFFRGLVFGYIRKWNLPAAVLISTALFAAFHLPTIPVTQVVGGLAFAIAYHKSGSLIAPIIIHILGNLAIFTLSLPIFH